jgi:hypothetical protein
VLTKREILEGAELVGLGTVEELRPKFRSWQRFGLVGKMAGKAPRRGGEGLWHPIQGDLFLIALRNEKNDTRLTTVANFPVGLWFGKVEGVELEQVRRALYYWATRRALGGTYDPSRGTRPSGRTSIREVALRAIVDQVAASDATDQARADLTEQLRDNADGLSASSPAVPRSFMSAYVAAAAPGRPSAPEIRERATDLYLWLRYQLIGVTQLAVLCSTRPDVARYWVWMRRYALDDLDVGAAERPPPEWARNLYALSRDQIELLAHGLERSCGLALTWAGVGLRTLAGAEWPIDLIRPPSVTAFSVEPSWAEPDPLLDLIDTQLDRLGRDRARGP